MSLVGPRPAIPSESDEWTDELRNRLRVRPGLTGMWQVSGRSETSFDEYQRLDLFYIDNWSMLTDIGILFRTIPAVLAQRVRPDREAIGAVRDRAGSEQVRPILTQ